MLDIQHLTKRYGDKLAVADLSLRVRPGELCAFIGHNGAGKTTTLKACAGILRPDEGDIYIGGEELRTAPLACKAQIAYIPDDPTLYEYLSGIKYLHFIADVFGVDGPTRDTRIAGMADAFSLTQDLAQPISAYSHGMKQKLALIAGFLHAPRLILMDEPFVGLDPTAAHTLKQMMRSHCEAGGAILFSTHVLEVAEKLCDTVAVIKGGRLVAAGDMAAVKGDASLESVFLELEADGDA